MIESARLDPLGAEVSSLKKSRKTCCGASAKSSALIMDPFASTEEKTAYQDQQTRRRLATGFATVVAIWLGAFVGAAAMDRAHDDAPRLHETAMAEDAPPRGGGAFRVANALEAASGRPIGSPAPRAAFLVDVARPSTFSHDDGGTRLWRLEGVHDSAGPTAEIWIRDPGPHTVRAKADGGAWEAVDVVAKVVRRELRSLSGDERAAYFGALHALYATDDALGRRLYGADFRSADWFVREHLYGAADRSCDHWHDDLGILNHHVGITWQLEKALRSVDGTTAAHYWDYSADAAAYGSTGAAWAASAVFGADWFGAASPGRDDHVLDAGAWAYTPVRSNAASYSNVTNAYGLLRSPWNTNAVPFLARYRYVLGNDGGGFALPSCADFVPFLNDPAVSLGSIASGLNGGLHGPVHIMVGGHWGFDEAKWASYLADYAPFSPSQVLLFSKFAWRTGFVTCPRACAADAPPEACRCSCPDAAAAAGDDAKALEVLDAMRFRAHALPFSDAFADTALEPGAATDDGAFFGAHGLSASDILDLVCAVGYPGELFTSAAPQDPLFWPLHGLAERFLQYARVLDALGAIDLDEAWRYKHRKNVASCVELNHWFGTSRPNFEILELGQIEVDSADFWTNRLLSSGSRRAAEESGPNRSITLTLKSS